MNQSISEQFHELSFYTLSQGDNNFIHQHAVDAQTAQTADENTKPISLVFALAGLYLLLEKNFSGREVQQMHMRMAANKKAWPNISLPSQRGNITVREVLTKEPGENRDKMIYKWCASVWNAFEENQESIVRIVDSYR